jgi:hypothetical protein
MAIFEVEHSGGYWQVRAGAEILPLRMAGQPVAALVAGWRPKFVYTGFAPIYLLELVHDNGDKATWFLDAAMNRLGGELEELSAETQSLLLQKYLDVTRAPLRSLMVSLKPAWPAAIDGLPDVNARTVYGLDKMAGSGDQRDLSWHDAGTADSTALNIENGGTSVQLSPQYLKSLLSIDVQENFLAALKAKELSWPSPITGKPVTRVHSLYIDNMIILYRCVDEEARLVFYVCCAGHDLQTVGVLFPSAHRAFYLTGMQRHLAESVCTNLMPRITLYLTRSGRLLPDYFARRLNGFATPLWGGGAFHVGHHLWNELSGLMAVVNSVPPGAYPWVIDQGKPGDGAKLHRLSPNTQLEPAAEYSKQETGGTMPPF